MMIHWCELCNDNEAEGVLTVLYPGQIETTMVQACKWCVKRLDKSDWIDNEIPNEVFQ